MHDAHEIDCVLITDLISKSTASSSSLLISMQTTIRQYYMTVVLPFVGSCGLALGSDVSVPPSEVRGSSSSQEFQQNVVALTWIRLFGLVSMIASGLIVTNIALKLYSRRGPFLQKVSLTQSILIVLAIGDFFA